MDDASSAPASFHVDTADVLAVTVGGLAGLWLLPAEAGWWTERVVVPLCALAVLTAKRSVLPTLPPRPDVHPVTRLGFLFLSILGSVSALGGLALVFVEVPDLDAVALGWPQARVCRSVLFSGGALLAAATVLDRLFLKAGPEGG